MRSCWGVMEKDWWGLECAYTYMRTKKKAHKAQFESKQNPLTLWAHFHHSQKPAPTSTLITSLPSRIFLHSFLLSSTIAPTTQILPTTFLFPDDPSLKTECFFVFFSLNLGLNLLSKRVIYVFFGNGRLVS